MSGLAECEQETDHVMTASEAALMLRLSRDSLYAAANRGDIPHRRVGRRMLFSRVALMAWLQGSSVQIANDEIARRRQRAA
jgi:excisionase family DNA binding protein